MVLRLFDAGQVEQIAVLAVLVVDVSRVDAGGRAPQNRHRTAAEFLHQPGTPRQQVLTQRGYPGSGCADT